MSSNPTRAFYARTILAIALAYVLVAKTIFAPALAHQGGLGIPGLDMVICSAHDGTAAAPVAPDKSHQNSCCDEGCLLRLLTLAAPLLAVAAVLFAILDVAAQPLARIIRRAAGPPWRIASSPGAQRAPPAFA